MGRRVFFLCMCLLLGAISTVAVAWGCSLWLPWSVSTAPLFVGRIPSSELLPSNVLGQLASEDNKAAWKCLGLETDQVSLALFSQLESSTVDLEMFTAGPTGRISASMTKDGPGLRLKPPKAEAVLQSWPPKPITPCMIETLHVSAGWPFSGLHGARTDRSVSTGQALSGLYDYVGQNRAMRIHEFWWAFSASDIKMLTLPSRVIPWRPLWPGFALDTAFYTAAWWVVLVAPFALRRLLRRRRGLCAACGYDLRGHGAEHEQCPECGHALTRERATHSPPSPQPSP